MITLSPCSKVSKGIKAQFCSLYNFPWSNPNISACTCLLWTRVPAKSTHFWFPTCAFVYPICSVCNILSPNSVCQNSSHCVKTVAVVLRLSLQDLRAKDQTDSGFPTHWEVMLASYWTSLHFSFHKCKMEIKIHHGATARIKQENVWITFRTVPGTLNIP